MLTVEEHAEISAKNRYEPIRIRTEFGRMVIDPWAFATVDMNACRKLLKLILDDGTDAPVVWTTQVLGFLELALFSLAAEAEGRAEKKEAKHYKSEKQRMRKIREIWKKLKEERNV